MLKYCRLCGVVADLSKVCVERQCFSVQLQAAAVSRNREETTAMPIYLLWDKGALSRME